MELAVVYARHNCFLLDCPALRTLFLFDYPARDHRDAQTETLVKNALRGADALVFSSHGHADHFTPEILEFKSLARWTRFVVSFDIAELVDGFDPEQNPELLVVEPDMETGLELPLGERVTISGFESTDLGVGFLIELAGMRIWFGGDVADWRWDQLPAQAKAFSERHYAETLERLAAARVDLAFVNTDKRLSNWAGGFEFLRRVRPRYFVPMHCFGRAALSAEFAGLAQSLAQESSTRIWSYAGPGESWRISL